MASATDTLPSSATAPLLPITGPRSQPSRQVYNRLPCPPTVSANDFYSVLADWNGTGERFDVDYNSLDPSLKPQLKKRDKLGQGHFGEVYKVTCRGMDLARKSIKIRGGVSEEQVRQLREESTLGQKLDNHRHIVKLIGTYWKGDHLNILIYPVAVCDLGKTSERLPKLMATKRGPAGSHG